MKYLLQVVAFVIAILLAFNDIVKKDQHHQHKKFHHIPIPTNNGWVILSFLVLSCAGSLIVTRLDSRDDERKVRQLETLSANLRDQNDLILRQSAAVQKQLDETQYALTLANIEIQHLDADITLSGVSSEEIRLSPEDVDTEKDLTEYATSRCKQVFERQGKKPRDLRDLKKEFERNSSRLYKPWTIPSNDCSDAQLDATHWAKSTRLLSYLDPSHHVAVSMDLIFEGFIFRGETNLDCPLWPMHQSYRCLAFWLSSRKPPLPSGDIEFGPLDSLERKDFVFGLRIPAATWEKVFRNQPVYERDANVRVLRLTACDGEGEAEETRTQHLRDFRSDLSLVVHLYTYEKLTAQFFPTDIVLGKNDKRTVQNKQCTEYYFEPTARLH